jgi:hypothetical protein
VEKTGEKRPWKSQERFPLSHSYNNNKLDDRDHFQQNAKTSVASLRGLIGSSRNIDRHHSGMLIDFIGIPSKTVQLSLPARRRVAVSILNLAWSVCEYVRRNGKTAWIQLPELVIFRNENSLVQITNDLAIVVPKESGS